MLKIRLQRVGRKHNPSFRIVLTDSKNGPKSGKFLEILGHYDPKKDIRKVDGERVKELMTTGAQLSDTVHNILINEKVIEGKKINVLPKKSPIVPEKTEEDEKKEETSTEEKSTEEAPAEETKVETTEEVVEAKEEAPMEKPEEKEEDVAEEKKEETPVEEKKEEVKEEAPKEEKKEETPAEEDKPEEKKEEEKTEEK